MPASRKACERCRVHKAKCVWTEGFTSCTRCRKSKYTCLQPLRPTGRKQQDESDVETTHIAIEKLPGSGKLGERLGRLEEILSGYSPFPNRQRPSKSFPTHTLDPLNTTMNFEETLTMDDLLNSAELVNYVDLPPTLDLSPFSSDLRAPQSVLSEDTCKKGRCYLPPTEEGHALLQDYLHDFNSKMPLFSPETLYEHYQACYSGAADGNGLTWVLVYSTIGISYRLRAMSLFAEVDDMSQAEWYLNKCLGKLPELLLQDSTLQLIQALLSVSFLLQTSNRTKRASLFVSTAMHMAQDLGYNAPVGIDGEESIPRLEERYCFWLAFFQDTHYTLATLRPNQQRLSEISTSLPDSNTMDWWHPQNVTSTNAQWNLNVFALHSRLAIIEAEALEELFSVKASKRSITSRLVLSQNLISKLEDWRKSNALLSLSARDVLRSMYRSDIVHSIMLEGAYFRTLYLLHAANILGQFRSCKSVFAVEALKAVAQAGITACFEDAQRLLMLAALIPQGNISTTWASKQALVAALCTVLSVHASVSADDLAVSTYDKSIDIHVYADVLGALELAAEMEDGEDATELRDAVSLCRALYFRIR